MSDTPYIESAECKHTRISLSLANDDTYLFLLREYQWWKRRIEDKDAEPVLNNAWQAWRQNEYANACAALEEYMASHE